MFVVFAVPVQAKSVTQDEALTVAKNWVTLVIQKEGKWGSSETAQVKEIREFKRGQRVIGYFCSVYPRGFIVISLRKELGAVKAYSETSNLDPEFEEGMAGLIKEGMEGSLDAVEKKPSPVKSDQKDKTDTLEIDTQPSWDALTSNVGTFEADLDSGVITMNYQGGDPYLLTSSWDQGEPYNRLCPEPWLPGCGNQFCSVGCTPLAGAQIMRYWAWPPDYDWVNMADRVFINSPQAQIDAVSQLCADVGSEAGATYCIVGFGCQTFCYLANNAAGGDLLDAFEDHFRYNDEADEEVRGTESPEEWFNYFKEQLNKNRPVPYELGAGFHVIVCDGWKEVGEMPDRYYHMNYGWGEGCVVVDGETYCDTNAWYLLDDLPLRGVGEHIIIKLHPGPSLGTWLSGDPPDEDDPVPYNVPSFPYRYFDQDATGRNVTFAAGHNLQFLPGVTVKGTSPEGDYIQFLGTPADNTRLFSIKGTSTGGSVAGTVIYDGEIRLYNTGSIRFH